MLSMLKKMKTMAELLLTRAILNCGTRGGIQLPELDSMFLMPMSG
jgi:hypothetical protein